MPRTRATCMKGLALLAALLLAACRTGPAPSATPGASATPAASAVPAGSTDTPGGAPTVGFLLASPDNRPVFVDTDGQELPLGRAPATRYVVADLSAQPGGTRRAYAVGPQGAQPLDFVDSVGFGLAAYQPPNAPGRLAWDHWVSTPDTQVDSQIFLSALDGSGAYASLIDSGDHALRVLRWSADGRRLFFSREPLGIGGYILYGGFSNLWEMNVADASTREVCARCLGRDNLPRRYQPRRDPGGPSLHARSY